MKRLFLIKNEDYQENDQLSMFEVLYNYYKSVKELDRDSIEVEKARLNLLIEIDSNKDYYVKYLDILKQSA